jgi:hypothetical protein
MLKRLRLLIQKNVLLISSAFVGVAAALFIIEDGGTSSRLPAHCSCRLRFFII